MSSADSSGQQQGQQNSGGGPQQGGGGDMTGVQQQGQGGGQQGQSAQQQQQQQLQQQLQQNAAQNSQGNQMQQLQVIQQPLQNQTYLQQLYNTQGQLLMPGNIALHPQLNPQIQVITGKTFQQNQLGSPHMLTTATAGYATIPTSAANNQAYIIGQLINSSQPSILQQHSQSGKPGEMQKVIQPQITQTQLPPGLTWATQPSFLQSPIIFRGQNDQMYIQQQQPLHGNAGSHQQFTTMPLNATGQLPTSISSQATNGLQQVQQQQSQGQNQGAQGQNQQSQQNQGPQAIQPANVLSLQKGPATLQPKPPLQIQPSPNNQQQQNQQHHQQLQQQQQQPQIQNVTMNGQQFQMIPQQTSQSGVQLSQQILAQSPQTITTTQVMQHSGQPQQMQQQPRQLILPQQTTGQSMQPQQVTFIQQTQQHQPIRPNYTVTATTIQGNTGVTGQTQQVQQQQGVTATPVQQQRPKIRKPGVGRGANNSNSNSPTQQGKVMYPRQNTPTSISPAPIQSKLAGQQGGTPSGATLTRIPNPQQNQQTNVQQQPLKTINMSALQPTPTLPDATLTPLNPQTSQITAIPIQPPNQAVQVFATTTQLPPPNISITPAVVQQQPKKDEPMQVDSSGEHKSDTEKENTKLNSSQSAEDNAEDTKPKLPKAMVKPQVLTHVIEGFVIQEASEPFPMNRNGDSSEEPPKKKIALSGEMGRCEMCGKHDLKAKFKKNKRFCSSSCAKGAKAQQQQHQNSQQQAINVLSASDSHSKSKSKVKKWGEGADAESTDETSSSMGDRETLVMSPATTEHIEDEPKMNPVKWNVSEVVDFVRSLPGCSEYADDFAIQEIDGQALMLLKEDHLMSAIGMKLGPALKLCAKIEALRASSASGNPEQNAGKA